MEYDAAVGERLDEEEQYAVKEMHADRTQGRKTSLCCLKKWMAYGCTCRTAVIKE